MKPRSGGLLFLRRITRSHGVTRSIFAPAFTELLKTSDLRVITTYLDYLGAKKLKGHWACPCRSGKKLRDCHFWQIKDLREKISRKHAEKSLTTLKAAGTSAIEMIEAKPTAPIV